MPSDVKPCPFCGSDDVDTNAVLQGGTDGPIRYEGACQVCDSTGPVRATRVEAIEAWNVRSES